jgi:prevent-host-death family protein
MTKTMKASEARQQFSKLLNEVFRGESRVVVEKSGIPVAAIISASDLQLLARLEQERAEQFKILTEIGGAFKDVPLEEIEREVKRAITQVRREKRQPEQRSAPRHDQGKGSARHERAGLRPYRLSQPIQYSGKASSAVASGWV